MKPKTKRTKAAKPKLDAAASKARAALGPVSEYCQQNRGALGRLTDLLSERTGETQHRQNVGGWIIHERRVEPRLGIGLLLLECFEALKRSDLATLRGEQDGQRIPKLVRTRYRGGELVQK